MRTAGVTLSLLLVLARPGVAAGDTWSGRVIAVADGDTITVLRDRTPVKVRLHGVDAPEKSQLFGEKAKRFTSKLVLGKEVRVEEVAKDKYGRTVARLYVTRVESIDHYDDGTHAPVDITRCLNEELVAAGLAWWHRRYSPKDKKLARLEDEAKRAKRGLWAGASPTPPWAWRHPELVCRQDTDCVFLPSVCARCAPCTPTPRRVGNRQALERIQDTRARVRCARPSCPPCASEKNWIGGKPVCDNSRCIVEKAADRTAQAAPSSGALYHGNAKSKALHAPGCRDYACKNCTVGFAKVEEARKRGYRPHAACVAAFEKCYSGCLRRSQARAVPWEMIEADCRMACKKAAQGGDAVKR